VAFYRNRLGFEVEAEYDDPPHATLSLAGTRLSLAEQGYPRMTGRASRWRRLWTRRGRTS